MTTTQITEATTTQPTSKTTEPTTTQQKIEYFMESAPPDGNSSVRYTNILNTGDNVSGLIQLVGEWELSGDWAYPWEFKVLNPSGDVVEQAIVRYDTWVDDPVYYFNFSASIQGVYTIEVAHISVFPRDLYMEIQPSGWKIILN